VDTLAKRRANKEVARLDIGLIERSGVSLMQT
jgi:hypothetical protein